jgi:hypothetical protein
MVPTNKTTHEFVERGTGKCGRLCCDKLIDDPVHDLDTGSE